MTVEDVSSDHLRRATALLTVSKIYYDCFSYADVYYKTFDGQSLFVVHAHVYDPSLYCWVLYHVEVCVHFEDKALDHSSSPSGR